MMDNPIKIDDLGVPPIMSEIPIWLGELPSISIHQLAFFMGTMKVPRSWLTAK